MKSIEVVAAVIRDGDRILATQRGYGQFKDWWEFPGGKIESGESHKEALAREIHEELDAEILIGNLIDTVQWNYPEFHLTMHCYWVEALSPIVLKEHKAARWLTKEELRSLQWLPADIVIVENIEKSIQRSEAAFYSVTRP